MWCQLRQVALSAVVLAGLAAQAARAAEPVTLGSVGQASANLWPDADRHGPRLLRRRGLAGRHRLRAVERRAGAAGHRRIARHQHLDRACRSATRRRHGRADRRRAHRGAGAALRSRRQAEHREPGRSQGQGDFARRRRRTSPASMSSACWRRTASSRAISTWCSPAPRRRAPRRWLAGAVDAAILLPAFNFQAMAKGFNSLGLTVDYVKDLPFSGTAVNSAWANANKAHAGETAAGAEQERSPGSTTSKIARRRCAS